MSHRFKMWAWVIFGILGVVDYAVRGDIAQLWEQPFANNIVILFLISVAANAIGEEAAEEAED